MTCVEWTDLAIKRLKKLEERTKTRIVKKLDEVSRFPKHYLKHLTGINAYSTRIGDYRAIIDWNRDQDTLVVLTVGHRRNIYRNIERFTKS